jgi:glycosyltransferase involved in cell wall biosynthesis
MSEPAWTVRETVQRLEPTLPRVTVAVPTYQREQLLARTLDSVLGQDYPAIELLIGDNASTDRTAEISAEYVARFPNVRYLRQATNVGPTPNFESLRSQGAGDYFLFLGDDDWIDPGYISACVAGHEAHPGSALVSGRTWYHRGDHARQEPESLTIDAPDGPARVLSFYRQVGAAGLFYGVVPAAVNERAPQLRNVMGGDLLHLACLAYLGPLRTLDDIAVHRTADGMTTNLANVAATLGLGWFQATAPQIAVAWWVFRDIAWDSPLFAELGRLGRLRLGAHAGWIMFWRFVPKAVLKFGRLAAARLGRRR